MLSDSFFRGICLIGDGLIAEISQVRRLSRGFVGRGTPEG